MKDLEKTVRIIFQIENFMENGREISISDFGFRSTFKEGRVVLKGFLEDFERFGGAWMA